MTQKLSIIVPAYNEAKTIRRLVERILAVPFPLDFEVIIVDDYSHDRTFRIANLLNGKDLDNRILIFRNDRNRGKGYCIRRGIENATGDVVMVQDADFEYDPQEIPKLLQPLLNKEADVVYGSRFMLRARPSGMAFPNYIANLFLTGLTNILYNSALTDMETCYKLVRKEILSDIHLTSERFDFEPEITAKLLQKKCEILELPIGYHGRSAAEGKKIKARDFFIAIAVLLKHRFQTKKAAR